MHTELLENVMHTETSNPIKAPNITKPNQFNQKGSNSIIPFDTYRIEHVTQYNAITIPKT